MEFYERSTKLLSLWLDLAEKTEEQGQCNLREKSIARVSSPSQWLKLAHSRPTLQKSTKPKK